MTLNSTRGRALASVQEILEHDLLLNLSSDRSREFAVCAARVIARLRLEESANTIAAAQLPAWHALVDAERAGGAGPAAASTTIDAIATHLAQRLDERTADPSYMRDLRIRGSSASTLFGQAVAATCNYLETIEAALPAAIGQGSGSPVAESTREQLSRYLTARFAELPKDPIRSFRIVPGGRGKETALFELTKNASLPSRLVLRRDLANSPTGTSVFAEFPLLEKLRALGLPIPTPVAAESDPHHLGGSFIIVTEVVGATRAGELFAELNDLKKLDPSFGPELARALALLHTLEQHPSGDAIGGYHASVSAVDAVRQFHDMWRGLKRKPEFSLATELGFAWLLSHPLPPGRPRRLVHGDVGLHNILVRDGKLAAILDWELTHLGDPAEDLGYMRAPLMQHLMSSTDFIEVYTAAGGDPGACDLRAIDWYSVWAHTRNSVYTALHYEWAITGQRTHIETFNAGIDFFARTQAYIARELKVAIARI